MIGRSAIQIGAAIVKQAHERDARRGRELLAAFGVGSRWAFLAHETRQYCWVTDTEAACLGSMLANYGNDNGSRSRCYLLWAQCNGKPVARASVSRVEAAAARP
jgi:hypothetical protein